MKLHPLLCSLIFAFVGCQEPPTAATILKRSVQAHGFDQSLDTLSYFKTTRLFYPDGSLEKEISQTHSIQWRLLNTVKRRKTTAHSERKFHF